MRTLDSLDRFVRGALRNALGGKELVHEQRDQLRTRKLDPNCDHAQIGPPVIIRSGGRYDRRRARRCSFQDHRVVAFDFVRGAFASKGASRSSPRLNVDEEQGLAHRRPAR